MVFEVSFKSDMIMSYMKICIYLMFKITKESFIDKPKSQVPKPSPAKQSQSQGSWTLG